MRKKPKQPLHPGLIVYEVKRNKEKKTTVKIKIKTQDY